MNTVALTFSDGILKNNRPCRLRALMTSTLALLPVTRTIGVFPTGAQGLPTVGVNRTTDSSSKKSRARCLLARRLIRGQCRLQSNLGGLPVALRSLRAL